MFCQLPIYCISIGRGQAEWLRWRLRRLEYGDGASGEAEGRRGGCDRKPFDLSFDSGL